LNCSEDSPKVQGVAGEPLTSRDHLINTLIA
jgi:hypothetical protein